MCLTLGLCDECDNLLLFFLCKMHAFGAGPLSSREYSPDPSSFLPQQRCWSTMTQNWTWLLAGDVSAYGIGAVLSPRMSNREERPVVFASRTLSSVECNYSQVEKEALATKTGVCLCNQEVSLIYFWPTVYIGHRPQAIAHPLWREQVYISTSICKNAEVGPTLAMYNYKIAFKPTATHSNANGLSRLPLPEAPSEVYGG